MVLIYRGDQLIGADIIDLKTEHFNSSRLHDHINRHRPQLQAYRTAAATFLRLPIDRISTRLVFIESGQIVNLHVIEGAIDFSPQKKKVAKKAAAKKPVIRMKPDPKPKTDKASDESPSDDKPIEPVDEKERNSSSVDTATVAPNPTGGKAETIAPAEPPPKPVSDSVAKQSNKKTANKKVDKSASANPPPAKSQSKPSLLRQKTLWD